MARPRLRSALLAAAVLGAGIPAVAMATAPGLRCVSPAKGYWQTLRVDGFKAVNGLSSPDTVSSYAVDEREPRNVAATNGVRVQLSLDHGCNWSDSLALSALPTSTQPFAGGAARIVSLAFVGDRRVAAVQEGSGTASRPHIMVQTPGGSWTTSDSGLPANGAPKLLRAANDGRTLYLTVSPTGGGGGDSDPTTGLPGLPGVGGGGVAAQTGLLYGSTDGGSSWTLKTTASDLPSGGTGFTALDIDPSGSTRLYGIVSGRLAVSNDGGASFATTTESDYTAITAMGPQTVVAFRSNGRASYSANGGAGFQSYNVPTGVDGVAYRSGDSGLLIDVNGTVSRLTLFDGKTFPTPTPAAIRTGTLLGDRGTQSSFHAVSGHSVLRYVDPSSEGEVIPPIAIGDTSVRPPLPGTVVPAVANVTLPVGESTTQTFTLNLPKNPTPLDLFFLVDVSGSQTQYIDNLKSKINTIVGALVRNKVDLKVGVGTLGAGPAEGEPAYPPTYVFPPTSNGDPLNPKITRRKYVRPTLYKLIRPVGDTGVNLRRAIDAIEIETDDLPENVGPKVAREGALLALSQAVTGSGIHTEAEDKTGLNTYEPKNGSVKPGQDAHFRGDSSVRRVIILSTDEQFDYPYPQRHTGDQVDFSKALRDLRAARTQVIGLTGVTEGGDSLADLRKVAAGTRTFAPPGGVTCNNGDDTGIPEQVDAGQPLVCNTADKFDDAIIRLLSSLTDRQNVSLVPLTKSPVLGALRGSALLGLDVKKPNSATFQVTVSCVDVKPGRYTADVATVLRSTKVGSARLNVTCLKAQAIVPPKPLPPVPNPPPPGPNPPAPAVPPLAPPAPAVQPQVQIQTQVQVNPMSAGAAQEQQELQLALAMAGVLKDDDPVFQAGTQMAMVDRRKREQVQGMYVLAFAMVACSGLGLARLRTKADVAVRQAR